MGFFGLAAAACALQVTGPAQISVTEPSAAAAPLTMAQWATGDSDTTIQLGGVNTNLALPSAAGRFMLSGGYYFSRITPKNEGMPQFSLGQEAFALSSDTGHALTDVWGSASDDVINQHLTFERDGWRFGGQYTRVGSAFAGLDTLKKQLSPTDAAALALGKTQTGYEIGYAGLPWLSLAASQTLTKIDNEGDKDNGLSRVQTSRNLGLALSERTRVEYTTTHLEETWDPHRQRNAREVASQVLKVATNFGEKSQFSLGQTTTATTAGATTTTVTQQNLALTLQESAAFGLTGGYQVKDVAESGEHGETLNFTLTAAPAHDVQCITKYSAGTTERPDAAAVEQHQLDVQLTHPLSSHLKLTHQFQQGQNAQLVATSLRSHQLAWTPAPGWTVASLLRSQENPAGETNRTEVQVTRKLEQGAMRGEISAFSRDEVTPVGAQMRHEARCTLADPASTRTLTAIYGQYQYTDQDRTHAATLLNLAATAKPTSRLALSLGYYAGPVLTTSYLTYRSIGDKPRALGSLEAWRPEDFSHYEECGGEMTYRPSARTKLFLAQSAGDVDDVGRYEAVAYGVEQGLGDVLLELGRREIAGVNPQGPTTTAERWWAVRVPTSEALPAWAATSLKGSPFADAGKYQLGQGPAWAAAPAPGFSLARRYAVANGKIVDAYAARWAGMLAARTFLQAEFTQHPNNPTRQGEIEPVQRGFLHLAYALNPSLQCYGRFLYETRTDMPWRQQRRMIGLAGKLSTHDTLHAEVEFCDQDDDAHRLLRGTNYALGLERMVGDTQSLALRWRLNDEDFVTPNEHVKLEGSYKLIF